MTRWLPLLAVLGCSSPDGAYFAQPASLAPPDQSAGKAAEPEPTPQAGAGGSAGLAAVVPDAGRPSEAAGSPPVAGAPSAAGAGGQPSSGGAGQGGQAAAGIGGAQEMTTGGEGGAPDTDPEPLPSSPTCDLAAMAESLNGLPKPGETAVTCLGATLVVRAPANQPAAGLRISWATGCAEELAAAGASRTAVTSQPGPGWSMAAEDGRLVISWPSDSAERWSNVQVSTTGDECGCDVLDVEVVLGDGMPLWDCQL